ncbi:UDP-N-acetylglucosamine--undecaprenyl-phosphate N-acetylglucosaminephosphotransferase [Motilimonas eburnea]|uniref:UDP-N-acetylglucosamine--undecaprenyl-phosphate N-acetylglucosaminephosphotransferase n=1 Tax=Motilimonas eburnea TaxID=1737488 RepID=UPI001E57D9FB|nr:UDP-N-acetylglucosamine--undecaprenyl-phosphate N-acetylglucosaminephosphotransferase [Motilimonas eburnea]MCE2573600.1 UDP-N-acetylglucosamine--undecaprenyl-phosphate N-acetylglucosaminephosphotransferase [Motilimonas eburnea]
MYLLLACLTVFALTCFSIKTLHPLAHKVGLVDLPNNRKHHVGSVPLIGGVSIYLGVLLVSSFVINLGQVFNLYLISTALVLFLGVLDDRYDLSVRVRLVAQVLIASILVFGAEAYLTSFGGILYFFEFKLGIVGAFVTIIAVIGCINAFNMVDGIDGLAGVLSIVAFASLALLFYMAGSPWFMLPLLFVAAISGYLLFNLSLPFSAFTKVFMGDAGSMLIGLTIVWLLVLGAESSRDIFSPVTALYIIAIPLMDMAAIMYRRMKKGLSPFKPDRDHLHHIFQRAGYSRLHTLIFISLAAIIMAGAGILGEMFDTPEWLMFTSFMIIFAVYNLVLANIWKIVRQVRRYKVVQRRKAKQASV